MPQILDHFLQAAYGQVCLADQDAVLPADSDRTSAVVLADATAIVVCVAGDGDFLMNGQEFATAVQYDLPIIVLLMDNGMYGTIRAHQEREFPSRVIATALRNPDFAAYARAFGGFGATIERTEEFPAAFKAARESGKPAILHLKVDPQAISPATTLDAIRAKSLAAQGN